MNPHYVYFLKCPFIFFVTLSNIIDNKFNNSLVIGVEKTYRITGKPNKILIL